MASVELNDNQWTQVIALMSYAPARDCMPLINEIGRQVATAHLAAKDLDNAVKREQAAPNGDGKEVRHE